MLPNVASMVAGERIIGSWWGHKRGHEIFTVLNHLNANPDALVTRLVSGKVTYLHRSLWPDFLAVATSQEQWQRWGVSRTGGQLYRLVQKRGNLRLDQVTAERNVSRFTKAAREIEGRLLVYSDEIHTDTGAHAKVLMTWARCPKMAGSRVERTHPAAAKKKFEDLVRGLNDRYGAAATLPWQPPAKR